MFNIDPEVQHGVGLRALPTGSYSTRAAFAFRGGSLFDVRRFAATAVLVQHPEGDLLIDAGFGGDLQQHLEMLPALRRSAHVQGMPVADQLAAVGYDLARLTGILLTHSHWDHVSGITDLDDVPILLTEAEIGYAERATGDTVFAAVSRNRRLVTYSFDGGPFEGFPASHDHYGDGSVVIVPAGGHTSGSVVVFVHAGDEKYAFIGDLAWQLDGVQRNVDRPWLMRRLADSDPARVREDLTLIHALADRYRVIPAHDERAYSTIPTLAAEASR